jgi:glycosyltransferase involved in cell wall biosynthesis
MVLLAHPGTQYSHQLARQLARHGALYQFWTGFAVTADGVYARVAEKLLPQKWYRHVANRIIHGVEAAKLRTMPGLEWKALRRIRQQESPQQVFHERNRIFQERIPDSVLERANALVGFDTSSWIIAERAEKLGKPFFLDQSISHPLANQTIMQEVARSYPEWQKTIEPRLPEVLACEQREHQLATKIIAASSFTKRTLIAHGVPAEKIIINPYGVDLKLFRPPAHRRERTPLRFLFLGSVDARKGAPLLVEAWRRTAMKNAELLLVGPVTDAERRLIPKLSGLKVTGKLPHRELPELLRSCDVLVFPSYCEGFAQVLLEAMASGMPVITTEATAGPDLMTDGVEGRIIPSGNLDALIDAMQHFARRPEETEKMSVAARLCAERFSWDAYGDRWQEILRAHA